MGIRQWLREWTADEPDGEASPKQLTADSLLGPRSRRLHALGEYDARNYPADLAELLRRRETVSGELLGMDIANRQARVEAIPRLRELLRTYPHPLAYEVLILAYVDAGRYDEARGAAFAAQARYAECAGSKYPEIRAEIDHLRQWSPKEVDRLRAEREERRSSD